MMIKNKNYEISTNKMRFLRLFSAVIDFCLIYLFIFIFYFVGAFSLMNSLLFNSLIALFYFSIFALFFNNQTLGKQISRLKIVYQEEKVWKKIIYLITIEFNFIPFLQFLFIPINIIYVLIKPTLMLHNVVSNTIVVYKFSNFAK